MMSKEEQIKEAFYAAIQDIDQWEYPYTDLEGLMRYAEVNGKPFPAATSQAIIEVIKAEGYFFREITNVDVYRFLLNHSEIQDDYNFSVENLDEILQVGLEVWLDKSIDIDEFLRSCIANY